MASGKDRCAWQAAGISDLAIETALFIRQVFHLPLRQTEGSMNSVTRHIKSTLNILSRLLETPLPPPIEAPQAFALDVEPLANVDRYDQLRAREKHHAA